MKTIVMFLVVAMLAVCGIVQVNAGMAKVENERTDYKCLNDCYQAGYSYGYCHRLCSY